MSQAEIPHTWRVRVYMLAPDGNWDEFGTGYLTLEDSRIKVISEDNSSIELVNHQIGTEIYRRQQETIITWTVNSDITYALSFQEQHGTQSTWEQICTLQGRNPEDEEYFDDSEDENDLTLPNTQNLESLTRVLATLPYSRRETVIDQIRSCGFIQTLFSVFKEAEGEGQDQILQNCFELTRALGKFYTVQLNSNDIIDDLISDDNYITFFSVCECKVQLDEVTNRNGASQRGFREFLQNEAKFNNVLEITDAEFLQDISHAFRLQFLKDVAMERCLSDQATVNLANYFQYTIGRILQEFNSRPSLKQQLYQKLQNGTFSAYRLLYELCQAAKSAQLVIRNRFYDNINNEGILNMLDMQHEEFTVEEKAKVNLYIPEILGGVLQINPGIVQSLLLSNEQKESEYSLLKSICQAIIRNGDLSIRCNMSDFIKQLLDPIEDLNHTAYSKVFHDKIIHIFIRSLEELGTSEEEAAVISDVLSIITLCVEVYPTNMSIFITYSNLLQKVTGIIEGTDMHVVIYGLKLIRAVIGTNDKGLHRNLITHQILDPIFRLFIAHAERQNMIFSCVLSIINLISIKKPKLLINDIVKRQLPKIDTHLHKYFNAICEEFSNYSGNAGHVNHFTQRELHADEDEDFFRESDSDSDNHCQLTPGGRKRELEDVKPSD